MNRTVACFLGAGFSYVAGTPLAKDLFAPRWLVTVSERSRNRFAAVRAHYESWQHEHPDELPEQYMAFMYGQRLLLGSLKWDWIVEYVGAVIASAATPPASLNRNPRYSNRVNRPFGCQAHQRFWAAVLEATPDVSVLTTNYDLLVERVLRHRPMRRPPSPGCYYGGLPRPQVLPGAAQPFSRWGPERTIEMTGAVPIFKLHGSLSWSLRDNSIVAYQDMRPAFSHGGTAAIVPPISEKQTPTWLHRIWSEAEDSLRRSDIWIVCGYSMPAYDSEILGLLARAGGGRPVSILIMSPDSNALRSKWSALLPEANLTCLPGIPEGIHLLAEQLLKLR